MLFKRGVFESKIIIVLVFTWNWENFPKIVLESLLNCLFLKEHTCVTRLCYTFDLYTEWHNWVHEEVFNKGIILFWDEWIYMNTCRGILWGFKIWCKIKTLILIWISAFIQRIKVHKREPNVNYWLVPKKIQNMKPYYWADVLCKLQFYFPYFCGHVLCESKWILCRCGLLVSSGGGGGELT